MDLWKYKITLKRADTVWKEPPFFLPAFFPPLPSVKSIYSFIFFVHPNFAIWYSIYIISKYDGIDAVLS